VHGQSLNGAMSVVLAAHNTPGSRFSSTVPIAPSSLLSFAHFLEHYSVEGGSGGSEQPSSSSGSSSSSTSGNYSVASAASSSSSALMLAPPTTRAQILRQRRQALGAAPYPLAGWLTEHLQVRESACRAPTKQKETFPHLRNLVLVVFFPSSSLLLLPVLNRISAFRPFLSNLYILEIRLMYSITPSVDIHFACALECMHIILGRSRGARWPGPTVVVFSRHRNPGSSANLLRSCTRYQQPICIRRCCCWFGHFPPFRG